MPVIWIWIVLAFFTHPYHVSVSVIEFAEKDKSLQITLYTFPDDLELAIEKNYGKTIRLDRPGPYDKMLIESYIAQHFQIMTNGKNIDLHFLGFTFENEKIVLLLEAKFNQLPEKLKVVNSLLTDIYPDQTNMVHFKCCGKTQTALLDKERRSAGFLLRIE